MIMRCINVYGRFYAFVLKKIEKSDKAFSVIVFCSSADVYIGIADNFIEDFYSTGKFSERDMASWLLDFISSPETSFMRV